VIVGINRRLQQREMEAAEAEMAGRPPPSPTSNALPTLPNSLDGRWRARRVDKLARSSFPIVYLLFNIVYWAVYTMASDDALEED